MHQARIPFDEPSRSATLHAYDVLDTPREEEFDDIAKIAAEVCGTPIAVVNLVDTRRQFFKAEVGIGVRETPLETSFCGQAILADDFMIVNDAALDRRFDGNPLVHVEGGLRFYAGALLKAPGGVPIGTVCVLDTKPRELDEHQTRTLKLLARQVMTQLELRRSLAAQAKSVERLSALVELGDRLRLSDDLAEMGRIAGEVVGRTLKISRAGFGRLDGSCQTITIEGDWHFDGQVSVAGTHHLDDFGPFRAAVQEGRSIVIADSRASDLAEGDSALLRSIDVVSMVNVPLISRGQAIAVFFAHDHVPREWDNGEIDFIRSAADRVQVSMARLRAQQDQAVVNQELSHRLKNTLAMVQAIATQTLRQVAERDAVDALTHRIGALSRAHELLLQQSWTDARMRDVTRSVLSTFDAIERFRFAGPDIVLGPRATLSLSLLLHELGTNAVKYGALSVPDGHVEIDWRLQGEGPDATVEFVWTEAGGPPALEPTRRGFGSRLIRMGLIGTGGVELDYTMKGFTARMEASLSQLQQS